MKVKGATGEEYGRTKAQEDHRGVRDTSGEGFVPPLCREVPQVDKDDYIRGHQQEEGKGGH